MSQSSKRMADTDEAALRAAGLRPVTIWVPDVTRPGFAEEAARQSRLLADADAKDPTIDSFLEAAWHDIVSETGTTEK